MTSADRNYMTGRDADFERQRLATQANLLDARTFEELDAIGIQPGWACLELGAGTGSIVRWLLDRVGLAGRVVAVDIDTTALSQTSAPNLDIRTGDATQMELGEDVFDLVTARAFFEHVPAREQLLADCVRALKPGGWLWLYDADYTPIRAIGSPAIEDRWRLLSQEVFPFGAAVAQTDVRWAGRMVTALDSVGLERIHSIRVERIQPAGAAYVENARRILAQRINLLGTLAPERRAQIGDAMTCFDDPALRMHSTASVTAWGRKPAGAS